MRPIDLPIADYSYLLGIYLGDGCITDFARTQRLRVFCDTKYPTLIATFGELLQRVFRHSRLHRTAIRESTTVLSVYAQHLSCLFPQHGPGKKHDRAVDLEPWQRDAIAAAPWPFLRGCIQTDGCHFVDRTGRYEYLSYEFSNLSAGVMDAFCWACELVGIAYRRYARYTRIYRRESVQLLVENVGFKT